MRGPTLETSEPGLSLWVVYIRFKFATTSAATRHAAGKHLSTSICNNKVQHRPATLVPNDPDTPKSHQHRVCSSATPFLRLEHK